MSAHKDISIPFTIKNGEEERRYKALGFLVVDEEELPFDEILTRTANINGGAVEEEDDGYIKKCLDQLPDTLQGFTLMTNSHRPDPEDDKNISMYYRDQDGWHQYYGTSTLEYSDIYLVICRYR